MLLSANPQSIASYEQLSPLIPQLSCAEHS